MRTITTTKGDMIIDEGMGVLQHQGSLAGELVQVEERRSVVNTATEHTEVVEFWLNGELIHRGASVVLKPQAAAQSNVGSFA